MAFDIDPGDKMLIITGKYFPESYTRSLNALAGMVNKHSQMSVLRDPVKNTYILLFLFITILIIFSASWLGFYLAKGITVPIEKLVAATSEIVKGNLDVRIDYGAKDEFNTLINEFNRMALDLKENRDKLTRRTIELRHRRSIIETILKNITSGVMALNVARRDHRHQPGSGPNAVAGRGTTYCERITPRSSRKPSIRTSTP